MGHKTDARGIFIACGSRQRALDPAVFIHHGIGHAEGTPFLHQQMRQIKLPRGGGGSLAAVIAGGVDLCVGGLGINGHIAFNEPPEPDCPMSAEEFAALPTRVLSITRETKTINAYGYQRGDLRGMPEWCITVGMKQILAARRVYIALNRPWQHGIVKHVLFDAVTAAIPASLLRTHPSVEFCASAEIAAGL